MEYWITFYLNDLKKDKLKQFIEEYLDKKYNNIGLFYERGGKKKIWEVNKFVNSVFEKGNALVAYEIKEKSPEGFSFSVSLKKETRKDFNTISIDVCPLKDYSILRDILKLTKEVYNFFDAFFVTVQNDEVDTGKSFDSIKKGKLPKYFEWFWIISPKIVKKYDFSKVPSIFKIEKMKEGGVLISEELGKVQKRNDMESYYKRLYKLPLKKEANLKIN